MKQKLIVNADDFGLSPAVNYGIIEAFQYGILTSTTLMVNQPFAEHAIALKRKYDKLGVGIHLTFDKGSALGGVSSLTDENGILLKFSKLKDNGVEKDFYKEAKLQIEKFIDLMGCKPTHLDSHHHIHLKLHGAYNAVKKLAEEYDLKMREPETLIGKFYDELATLDNLLILLKEKKTDIIEVMCHPGYIDSELLATSSYNKKREDELKILKNTELLRFVTDNFQLIDYLENVKEETNE